MIFDGCHFEYGNFNSREYDIVFAHLDTSIETLTSGEIGAYHLFNKKNQTRYIVGNDYSDSAVSMEVEIVTSSARPLALNEKRKIEKVLFNRHNYRKLYIDMADDYFCESYEFVDGLRKRLYLNCRFTNPYTIEDGVGRTVGYKCTMECESLMFTQDEVSKKYEINNGAAESTSIIAVSIDTDLDEYLYPNVTIQVGAVGGDIIIFNNDDSTRLTKFIGVEANAIITMRGATNYVSGQYYEKFSGRNFIRLLDGDNMLTVMGDVASITFEYSARRML